MPAAIDAFAPAYPALDSPYTDAEAVTPSDTVDLAEVSRAIYVGVAGDLTVIMAGGDTVLFKAAPVGILPIRVSRVKATGTAATNITALS